MTTDELLQKLPSYIGNHRVKDCCYVLSEETDQIGSLHLCRDGRDWLASYGIRGEFVCMNPKAEKPPYNNALAYGKTPNEALQGLYNWCIKNGFIKEE